MKAMGKGHVQRKAIKRNEAVIYVCVCVAFDLPVKMDKCKGNHKSIAEW